MNIVHLTIIDSTNDEAQRRIQQNRESKEDYVIRADFQTDGRGQRGNIWESESRKNLMFSYVFHPKELAVNNQFMLSQATAAAVAEYFESRNIPDVSIKWPNDIYTGMKKICGMLIENSVSGKFIKTSILGIGINVNQETFPENLPNPVSMKIITGKEYNLDTEMDVFLEILQKHLAHIQHDEREILRQNYMKRLLGLHKTLVYNSQGKVFKGIIREVDPFGFITVENEQTGECKQYDFKEIELIIPEQNKYTTLK
ncbi:MAG: biotin--[Bacteroidales bacterium]|nr:biotin--[acetyl-CoA-carboxylase] ligase [Bacteroidales bacterium]MBR2888104.1 biotin--[acetyl-CoA-carboxylase] ligase [Bacteroidales bacterium]